MQSPPFCLNFEIENIDVPRCEWHGLDNTRPDNDFIVAYKTDGTVASRYGSDRWDFSAYAHGGLDARFDFSFWVERELDERHLSLCAEIKWLDFCNIWKRTDAVLAFATYKLLHLAACRIASYAYEINTSIESILCTQTLFTQMVKSLPPAVARNVRHLLSSLARVESVELGFTLINVTGHKALHGKANESAYEQTAPIPTRIYSKLLSTLSLQLSEKEKIIEQLLRLVKEISSHPLCGKSFKQQRTAWKSVIGTPFDYDQRLPDFETLVEKHGLGDYCRLHSVSGRTSLTGHLSTIQTLCKLAVHAYSGMRDNEVETLPFGCLIAERLNDQIHNIVVGETYKFSGGVGRRAKWVIGADAARGIQLAQKISQCVFTIAGIEKVDGNTPEDNHPLFVSLLYLRFSAATRPPIPGGRVKRTSGLHLKDHREWLGSFELRITKEDVNELNNLDPFRDWKRTPYTIGNHWPLATHQLRRSLALYASRSGLVSLPSLRRQLKHITQEMSIYYAKGSQFAKDFLGNADSMEQRHFSVELQETEAESEMLSFLLNVIDSDERLFGGQGTFWQRQKERRHVHTTTVDRKKTLKEFSDGLRTYRVTPLGGCGKVGECHERAMGSFMECVIGDRSSSGDAKPCKYSYIKVSRLREVIASQESRLIKEAQLGMGSMYYKETLDDLNVLRNYLTKIQN